MAGFLYFIPHARGSANNDTLAKAGLGHVLDPRRSFISCECDRGPGRAPGLVVADERTVQRVGYYEQDQEWHTVPGTAAECWVGFNPNDPPEPHELARTRFLSGNPVTLSDGQDWYVPIVRGWILPDDDDALRWAETLPTGWALDEKGKITGAEVIERLKPLARLGGAFFDWIGAANLLGDEGKDAAFFPRLRDGAVELLAANYAVSAAELVLIGAMDDETAVQVLNACIDLDRLLDWVKKKVREVSQASTGSGSTTPSGSAERTPAVTGHPVGT